MPKSHELEALEETVSDMARDHKNAEATAKNSNKIAANGADPWADHIRQNKRPTDEEGDKFTDGGGKGTFKNGSRRGPDDCLPKRKKVGHTFKGDTVGAKFMEWHDKGIAYLHCKKIEVARWFAWASTQKGKIDFGP